MQRNTYVYENRIFTNEVKFSIVKWGKGKDRLMLVKTLINSRVSRGAWRARYSRQKKELVKVTEKCKLIFGLNFKLNWNLVQIDTTVFHKVKI